jgi:ribonuclease HI
MIDKDIAILHVDGSLSEYLDKKNILHKYTGVGGYLVKNGKIVDKFSKKMKDIPHANHHEDYAIIEGLKWLKEKKIKSVKIKTDSMPSIKLFNHKKKTVTKIDKFFLLQYLMLEYSFDYIEIVYHNRSEDDLSHILSREYLSDIPKDAVRLHHENHKKIKNYEIKADAAYHCDKDLLRILCNQIKEIELVLNY